MTESPTLRVAFFADSAPQPLARALEGELQTRGYRPDIRCWAFASPLAVQDELEAFRPDAVVVWCCAEAERFPELEPILALPYRFLVYDMVTRDDGTCGGLALTYAPSLRARILDWNARLQSLARTHANLSLVDLDLVQSLLGRGVTFDPRLWEVAACALAPAALPEVARRTADTLCAAFGRLRKVLVTDLDGTLWDGIVSEVGPDGIAPEAPGRQAYRAWLRALAARGILLAVASHNDWEPAHAAFRHPAMEMVPEDFLAFEADWGPKSAMLRRIAAHLHVGTDALVFVDDRPEQRAEVRAALPEVAVPELPADPALWPEFLARLNLFETAQITADDALRAQSLRADHARERAAQSAPSREAYLASLNQELFPEPLGPANAARAAQLTQRCNQFNMRGTRHTEAELAGMRGWVYRLRDRFGDLGIVSAVVLNGAFIETWVISCRALNRGVEALILNHLKAQEPNLCGAYLPTDRNARCRDVYATHGVPLREPSKP